MRIRVGRRSTIALAAAAGLASTGTVYVGARNLLSGQADQARRVIPKSWDIPPRADGVYSPGGGPVERWHRGMPFDLHLMIFGDSTAAGYGCASGDELPGVLIARGLAEESCKRVRLSTKAIVGATSKGLSGQIDAMFVAGPPPDAAVIMIGANDITKPNGIGPSARRVGRAVRRLRGSGAVVVVGTCPDFGVIRTIPQPLRWVARSRGLRLARAQASAVRSGGGVPVPFSDLLAPHFRKMPEVAVLATTCSTRRPPDMPWRPASCCLRSVKRWETSSVTRWPRKPLESRSPEGASLLTRVGNLSRLWRRSTGVPAPVVV